MKRDTWIPYTNDRRVFPPPWLERLDSAIGRIMCALGLHTDEQSESCWYCGKGHQ